jgi:hypothetical protein
MSIVLRLLDTPLYLEDGMPYLLNSIEARNLNKHRKILLFNQSKPHAQ